ncbi:MAG TPA: AsnC family transcriptional regulator [Saprospirales bacterium]|jgi:Lrp/AsnC family transcriptional regulator, leucine-responsive regulatory protein|nr:Lrp/AsnC family transcriptional regulator [Saprospiraceae bacterium]MDA9625742.1 Lrp/AsnC family transcriptional regulator [bacterium]HAV28403.1 AsnC family transcriptional regulator [Saprospirales bacterium]MDA9181923.1 Lrp/AsnC family transcriptional regulator [Saprospiraceae bacterium]MDC1283909.1 Lrp/AsnC family transcriptional regulator [Saprospiraceae bacterium]
MTYNLDATDRRIINLLEHDAKTTIKDIAAQLNMSTTPIFDRIKRLEKTGYIKGYAAIVDSKMMGFNLIAYCTVTLEIHHKEHIRQFVNDVQLLSEVIECYHIAGLFDYLLKIYVEDMNDYQLFITEKLSSIKNIGKVQSSFVMTEIKNVSALPLL